MQVRKPFEKTDFWRRCSSSPGANRGTIPDPSRNTTCNLGSSPHTLSKPAGQSVICSRRPPGSKPEVGFFADFLKGVDEHLPDAAK